MDSEPEEPKSVESTSMCPYGSTRRQQAPTNRTARPFGATASPAFPAGSLAAEVASLYSGKTVIAHAFSTTGRHIAAGRGFVKR